MTKKSVNPEIFNLLLNTDGDCVLSMGAKDLTVPLEDLRKVFEMVGPKSETNLLPPVVRSFSTDMTKFLVERIPFQATVNFSPYQKGSKLVETSPVEPRDYTIWFPWTYYFITLAGPPLWTPISVNVFCRTRQISCEEDRLYSMGFPNIDYFSGLACVGNTGFGGAPSDHKYSINEAISEAINGFWSSRFNSDYGSTIWMNNLTLKELGISTKIDDDVVKWYEHALQGEVQWSEADLRACQLTDMHLLGIWERLDKRDVLSFEFNEINSRTVADMLAKMNYTVENQSGPTTASAFANWVYRRIYVPQS